MKVTQVVPILNVTDVEAGFAWFARLGWSMSFQWDAEPHDGRPDFGGVHCGGHEIFLCRDGQGGRGDKAAWISIWVDDVDAVHERCLAEGLEVTHPPTDEPWGVREMHVRHPDGHVLRIGRQIDT